MGIGLNREQWFKSSSFLVSERKPTLEGEELRWNNGFQRSDSSGQMSQRI